ncbi:tRNA (adenosine(37)-N6)-threonylcarbamoyltransferase complex dimerization subunit type 1 TsaB [Qipengyuania vesicularis]|uniref:tRNA (adenosine(37)-N6)-threonylcarbamoyltransferase complex dimerization subunit type 1 TsaB n=1 Tax=Qipengyuania vesicularis TaxID=2867232 RepID=UPI001C87477F|nr:tRNA (adenosine(37)-N6)-threonylcarbamoyltransferase complex dimerization subunit type 1 TsaB [Qipengyuania vesicularis]MBX7527256.1 tRNA (adenosine(37)-N6)-threonylcarbamoyltransferase complex dimerization subunit type 1 TsaB [Qipengyuania vesicularis]
MRLLAIETSGEACSVALFEDGELLDARHETIGRGHAERLVPMIGELPGRGRADEIRVSLGPGSFTGVRIGLAAARALGLAWGAKVRGYPTLALIAAMAREGRAMDVGVCMNGGHGEWFVQGFEADGHPATKLVSLPPQDAVTNLQARSIAGNRAAQFVELAPNPLNAIELLADARHVLAVPEGLITDVLSPIYGRAPDAKLPA